MDRRATEPIRDRIKSAFGVPAGAKGPLPALTLRRPEAGRKGRETGQLPGWTATPRDLIRAMPAKGDHPQAFLTWPPSVMAPALPEGTAVRGAGPGAAAVSGSDPYGRCGTFM